MSTGRKRSSSSHSTRSVPARRIAADLHALPGSLVAALGPGRLARRAPRLQDARAVKDPDEIEAIRAATEIADAGQAAARAGLRPGADELSLWTETRAAMEHLARSRLPVLADFVTGERTAEVGGPPAGRDESARGISSWST